MLLLQLRLRIASIAASALWGGCSCDSSEKQTQGRTPSEPPQSTKPEGEVCGKDDLTCPLGADEQLVFDGEAMPKSWAVAGDPCVVKIGDQWHMFLGSIPPPYDKIVIISATLPKGAGLDTDVAQWQLVTTSSGEPQKIVETGAADAWDKDTVETSKYVYGYDNGAGKWVERLYYTGWGKLPDGNRDYRIGYAEKDGAIWVKSASPAITGSHDWEMLRGYSFIGDQTVYYEPGPGPAGAGGTWHMWYNANGNTQVTIGHATSSDGVNWPSANRKPMQHKHPFAADAPIVPTGPYHPDLAVWGGRYHFVGHIPSPKDLGRQGLWITSSTTPDGSAAGDFGHWRPLVFDNSGATWHMPDPNDSQASRETGLFSGTLAREGDTLWLFYFGVTRSTKGSYNRGSIGRAKVVGYAY